MIVRLGSRGSRLALTQAELAADALRRAHPGLDVALVPITTTGDRDRSKPCGELGARGVFVKEIEAGFSPIAVSLRTRRPTRSACRKSRCRTGPAVPAALASS